MTSRVARLLTLTALLVLSFAALPPGAVAHDIPTDVTVQMYIRPAGDRLNVIVRVPLKAMRDFEFPERGPGYLDLARVDAQLREAAKQWISDAVEVYEGEARLASARVVETRVSLESDKSFKSYEEALAHVTGSRLPNNTDVYWDQTMLDVLLEYPIHSDQSSFAIHPGLARLGLRVVTVVRFLPHSGVVRAFEFLGDPGVVRLDPEWYQAALRFVELGFMHILDGTDHLLFLFCLVIPFRRLRGLIPVVTAFTVAHSITLIASAYNLGPDSLWFPPLIETLIAISILYMALENIVGGVTVERRWMVAFGFGLVHGFGFSFILRQTLQFAGAHLLASLLSFNVGVELGQLLVLVLLIPLLEVVFRFVVRERLGTIILSAIVAHTAWHWMIDRAAVLRQFRFEWPSLPAARLVTVMHWLMLFVILAGVAWLVFGLVRTARNAMLKRRASSPGDTDQLPQNETPSPSEGGPLTKSPYRIAAHRKI
jgi:hypothetical protein